MSITIAIFAGIKIKNNRYSDVNYALRDFKALTYRIDYSGNFMNYVEQIPPSLSKEIQYRKLGSPSIPVLVYHGIPNESDHSLVNITLNSFKNHIFALKRAGYNTIDTNQLLKFLQGKIQLPDKSIMITFDDGRVDSLNIADPLLSAVDYKAVMFAIGRYSLLNERSGYYLTRDNLKEMNTSGRWDIQAHSYDGHGSYYTSPIEQNGHFFSHKIWLTNENRLETDQEFETRISSDLEKVKKDLGAVLGKEITSFAYPYGDYGQNSTNYSQAENTVLKDTEKNYSLGFYQISPENHFTANYFIPRKKDNSFFLIHRMNINPEWSGEDLINAIKKGEQKPLPYDDDFSEDKGWVNIWSGLSFKDNALNLFAENGQTGSSAVLDGSRLWDNYFLNTTVNSPHQQGIYVWARFQDEKNNASCNFGKDFIHIEEIVNGVKKVVQGTNYKMPIIPKGDFSIEVQVKGRSISCIINNTLSVETTFLDESLSDGGIGFKTWEETPGQSSLTIKNLHVTEIK